MKKKRNNLKQYLNKGISTPVGILIVLLVTVVAGVLIWQFWPEEEVVVTPSPSPTITPTPSPTPTPTPSADETADWEVYRNEEYGYEIKYPGHWMVANSIMELHKEEMINPYYTPLIEDWVMITNLSMAEEKEYLEELEDLMDDIGMGTAFDHIDNADGRAIEIFPFVVSSSESLKNEESGYGWKIFNIREEKTEAGLNIIRRREILEMDTSVDAEQAFILYHGNKILRDKRITHIGISIEVNEGNYEKDIFEKILSTFKFID